MTPWAGDKNLYLIFLKNFVIIFISNKRKRVDEISTSAFKRQVSDVKVKHISQI